jgi:hypothetical protein
VVKPRKHLVIPDTQLKPGVPTEHLDWMSRYIVEKTPDVIVIIGDWADMPSLSTHDEGTMDAEGREYRLDILAANDGLQKLMAPIKAETERRICGRRKRWAPRLIVTLGNHEHRINRYVQRFRIWNGKISTDDILFKQWGFEVYPFLEPVEVDGVAYAHYFISGNKGQPISSAKALLTKKHMSCVAGHKQGFDIATDYKGNGKRITGIINGACYLHDEKFMGPQGNRHFRGLTVLNEVNDGEFDPMPVSLNFLREKYA